MVYRLTLICMTLLRVGICLKLRQNVPTTTLQDAATATNAGEIDTLRKTIKNLEKELAEATEIIKNQAAKIKEQAAGLKSCKSSSGGSTESLLGSLLGTGHSDGGGSGGVLPKLTESYFCPKAISDNNAWRVKRSELVKKRLHGYTSHGQWKGIRVPPTYYCSKLYNNLDAWVKPKLQPEDLVVGVFTGLTKSRFSTHQRQGRWVIHICPLYFLVA